MNYLAHAYLSFNLDEILTGNMISDYVKGKQKLLYTTGIQKGIMLHRAIDNFTDMHPVTKEASSFFKPIYRLYAGSLVDIVYDHFLAKDTGRFKDGLDMFAQKTYKQLEPYKSNFPEIFSLMFPYMKKQNWLYNYQYMNGIANSFKGLVNRASYLTDSQPAMNIFETNYEALGACYDAFFPEVENFAKDWLLENGVVV